jgi:hypothetical protein
MFIWAGPPVPYPFLNRQARYMASEEPFERFIRGARQVGRTVSCHRYASITVV